VGDTLGPVETARQSLAVVTTRAPDDDAHLATDKLTDKQERFAQAWASTGNKAAAYRIAYSVQERTLPQTVWESASRVAALPHVVARFKVLSEQAALETIMSLRELLQLQVDIATADPAEIVKTVRRNCRYCHGDGYAYQWKNVDEYIEACTLALQQESMPPTDTGGYGFNGALEPEAHCPHCYGVGTPETIITPSDRLVGKARKLYAGAKQDRFGCIEIKLHDQQKAAELVGRMLGAFNDKLDLRTPEERAKAEAAAKLPDNITAEGAAKAYLQLIN
jgi:phage terminase small subunit